MIRNSQASARGRRRSNSKDLLLGESHGSPQQFKFCDVTIALHLAFVDCLRLSPWYLIQNDITVYNVNITICVHGLIYLLSRNAVLVRNSLGYRVQMICSLVLVHNSPNLDSMHRHKLRPRAFIISINNKNTRTSSP